MKKKVKQSKSRPILETRDFEVRKSWAEDSLKKGFAGIVAGIGLLVINNFHFTIDGSENSPFSHIGLKFTFGNIVAIFMFASGVFYMVKGQRKMPKRMKRSF
jgi:hypothetical protein